MRTYNTEIISVGTELLLGHVVNTDASDVSQALSDIGINVLYHTVVGDNPGRLEKCIKNAAERADIIITTGGLGPTCDDLTKQIICKAFGVELERNEEEYRCIYEYMTARHGYTENNTQQAMLPAGCTVFHNSCGTAPGCAIEKDGKIVIMLPGPPKECRIMLRESVVPYLKKLGSEAIVSHSVKVFGICESGIDDMFAEEMNGMTNPSMAPYAKEADCFLKITAKAETAEEAEKMCAPVMERVISRLGDNVYGVDVENLEEVAASLLKEKGKTLAIAEGFTGGFLSDRFTSVCPDPASLRAGFVMPYAGTSEEVAEQMAVNIRNSSGADIALAVGGDDEGKFFIALSSKDETFVRPVKVGMPRPLDFRRRSAANYAFDLLRRYLSGLNVI
ncbi:MAG: CinA family nicotinamide mononucleotide deamidase-related protein [Eubacteriales bacterium]|nr:CinA family nicotinamide mononucleotide deamidase-related protein [Eubacteriales bacterium]